MTASGRPTVAIWKDNWLPGSETFVRNQSDALTRWSAVCVGLARMSSPVARNSDVVLFGSSRLARMRKKFLSLSGVSLTVFDYFRRNKVDLIHAHFAVEALSVALAARLTRTPLLVTLHGHDVTTPSTVGGFRGTRLRWRLRRLFRQADTLIAVSGFIRDQAVSLGADPAKILVHHIGIPTADPLSSEPAWDIVFVGRLVEKKGIFDLIEAVSSLPAPYNEASIAIVGNGPLKRDLETAARLRGVRATFLGMLPPNKVREVLSASRIFCGPSRVAPNGDAEGFGMVFLEAAQEALPVVAYAHGGVIEAVQNGVTGLLSKEGDVLGLTANLRSLLTNPQLRASMGRAGQARVREEFDVRAQTQILEDVYDEVLARRP